MKRVNLWLFFPKINKKLKRRSNSKTFVSNSNYRKYLTDLEGGKPKLDESAIAAEAHKDGIFGVITNVPAEEMSAREIVEAYKHLWVVEDAFGEIKGTLKARPVFHWTDERIIGHLTVCFLAYFCEAQITKLIRQKQIELSSKSIDKKIIQRRTLTGVEAMKELAEVRAIPVKLQRHTFWVRTDIQENAAKIFKALGIAIPPKLIKVVDAI